MISTKMTPEIYNRVAELETGLLRKRIRILNAEKMSSSRRYVPVLYDALALLDVVETQMMCATLLPDGHPQKSEAHILTALSDKINKKRKADGGG